MALLLFTLVGFLGLFAALFPAGYVLLRHGYIAVGSAVLFAIIPLLIGLCIASIQYSGAFIHGYLRPRVGNKINRKYQVDPSSAWFVGICPGRMLRLFGSDTVMDVGFLSIEPGKLVFYGDLINFELKNVQVSDISLHVGILPFGLKVTRVIISWTHPGIDGVQETAVETYDSLHVAGKGNYVQSLFSALSAWQNDSSSPGTRRFDVPPSESEFSDLKTVPLYASGPSCLINIAAVLLAGIIIGVTRRITSIWSMSYGKLAIVLLAVIFILLCVAVYRSYKRSPPNDRH